jgi:hypothetical protein
VFLERSNERHLPADYRGDILLWDIDKTYLDTPFSSWKGLFGILLEFAIDKRSIAGAVPLLRALRRGGGTSYSSVPLYFVSGSPPQLRKVIERRMTLDGIDYDGITFKDQWRLLLSGCIADIRHQLVYKLLALLLYWRELPKYARWLCFGDDVESDMEVFVLFDAVCSGYTGRSLESRLRRQGSSRVMVHYVLQIVEQLEPTTHPVERIFVHLEKKSLPELFDNPRVVATRSYIQTALVLAHMKKVRPEAITAVAQDLRRRGFSEQEIHTHVEDIYRRHRIAESFLHYTEV